MLSQPIYYQEEKAYTANRMVVVFILTSFGILFSNQVSKEMASQMFLISFSLVGLASVSVLHYFFILRYPNVIVSLRKNILIFLDLVVLTFCIAVLESYGLFLFPLYVMIVMWSGLNFGIEYFYTSIVSAIVSWFFLLIYSEYWMIHNDILATFAITTFMIPLFYLKYIISVHDENNELNEILITTEQHANYDMLTGIPNRKMYRQEMKNTLKEKESFALLFIDLNKFKDINDNHGHHIGDNVLIEVAERLKKTIGEEDFLARLGGDEFVIISKRKKVFLENFLKKLEGNVIGKHVADGILVSIELSIGVSIYPDDSTDEVMLGIYADEAMYIVKKKENIYHMFYGDIKS